MAAQVPPDSIRADTIPRRLGRDTLPGSDTVPARASQDTTTADTIFYNLPELRGSRAQGWGPGVWSWDHDALMASGATNLAELVATVPGMVPLQGGDYGTPLAISAFGVGGGRVRIIRDGFEVVPLEGGVTNLSRVGLGGITEVTLDRQPGELIIRMESIRYEDARPYSLVEAGTGDFDTNFFRGTFANPHALGGSVALALERNDTRGPRGAEPGSNTGSWLRYELHRGDAAGIAVDFRRMSTQTDVTDYASPTSRTDWSIRGRARLLAGLTGEAYWGRSTHKVTDSTSIAYAAEGGRVTQTGIRAAWEHGGLFATTDWRKFGGDRLPSSRLDLSAGGQADAVGGFVAEREGAKWMGTRTADKRLRAWTRPLGGLLTLFGSWEKGTVAARTGPVVHPLPVDTTQSDTTQADTTSVPLPEAPLFHVTDRTTTRFGAQLAWRGLVLSGARVSLEVDSLLPLGLEMDRGQEPLPGGKRSGWEASATVPIPVLDGLSLEGSLQQWDSAWSYMPRRIYEGAFVYHNTFLPTGDLEIWTRIGVRGHDPMAVRVLAAADSVGTALASVPFYQSWYWHLQIRVVTVRIFANWENFSIRRNLQDFPDRVLPITRASYGIRWNLWN
ncbi:MAG: Plug domain-containing protein [Gemmatimonadetes bacterium]|nr:Plug domain-containing protein [Gemmatimonadota bacterium]